MKVRCIILAALYGILASMHGADGARGGTITKVVKLLEKMLDQSKQDAENDRIAYAKYKCWADKSEAEKTASIKKLTEQAELLGNKIGELQATNGQLTAESARLSTDNIINKGQQKQAANIRADSEKAFKALSSDLDKAIKQMDEAISVLSSMAASLITRRSWTKSVGDEHKFMAGNNDQRKTLLMSLGSEVKSSLHAVSSLLPPERRQLLESFLQASPAKAAKAASSDVIVNILKEIRQTFKTNLANSKKSEAAEKQAFDKAKKTMQASFATRETALTKKQQDIGSNDGELGAKKTQLDDAKKQKMSDEDFLAKLRKMASDKAKDYEERQMLRRNEDAAIAQAIAILNSDEAFDTFGEVDATKAGRTSFLQVRQHGNAIRQQAETLLEIAVGQSNSARLTHVSAALRSGNPFKTVLDEIDEMKKIITKEAAADKDKLSWCKAERKNSNTELDKKKAEVKILNDEIDKLDDTINDPKTGLKQQINDKEAALLQNGQAQVEETTDRKQENAAYQTDVRHLIEAEDVLKRALSVLKKYYDALDKKMKAATAPVLLQEAQSPPKTYGAYDGQSKSGGDAVNMIAFILSETEKEHKKADDDEKKAKKDFEDNMKKLKKAQTDMQTSLVKLQDSLANKEKKLEEKESDLKDTTDAKETIEGYLQEIKPGCDFITTNFNLREKNRATETKALDKASTLIKGTAAYKQAVAAKKKALAKCKTECKLDTTSLKCKACMAGSSEQAYCKSNPGMVGCK